MKALFLYCLNRVKLFLLPRMLCRFIHYSSNVHDWVFERLNKCRLGCVSILCVCVPTEARLSRCLMSELKTGTVAFLSGERCWMFSSLRRVFNLQERKGEKNPAADLVWVWHTDVVPWAGWALPNALCTRSRLVWLCGDHWIGANDSSALEIASRALEPDSRGSLMKIV